MGTPARTRATAASTSVVVLPVPGPASTSSGPPACSTTRRWPASSSGDRGGGAAGGRTSRYRGDVHADIPACRDDSFATRPAGPVHKARSLADARGKASLHGADRCHAQLSRRHSGARPGSGHRPLRRRHRRLCAGSVGPRRNASGTARRRRLSPRRDRALLVHERLGTGEDALDIWRANVYRIRNDKIVEIRIFEADQYAVDAWFSSPSG